MSNKFCVFDIDGILNYYPQTWLDFANERNVRFSGGLGKYDNLKDLKENVSYAEYKRLKEEYRLSGVKAKLEVRESAKEVIDELKSIGYNVILISARPVTKYPDLYRQTKEWLQGNELQYDNLLFSSFKQYDVIKDYPDIDFLVEDNRTIVNIMSKLGYNSLLLNNQYNDGKIEDKVVRIDNLKEVLSYANK